MASKRQKRKGWLLPDPVEGYDLIDICLKIPDTQLYRIAFFGAITELTKWWNWEKSYQPDDTRARDAAQMWRQLLHNYYDVGCVLVGYRIRQNPDDDCLIEQSFDDGDTWETAWRLDLCAEKISQTDMIIQINLETQIRTEIINRYDGSNIITINPNLTISTYDDGGNPERVEALCMAVNTYVKSYMATWVQQAQFVLGMGVFAILIISTVPFLGWLAGLVIASGSGLFAAASVAAGQNPDAIDDVICCMFDYLRGKAITQANFTSSLSGCGFGAGDSETVRGIVASDLGNQGNWIVFMDAVGRAFPLAQAGVIDCPCDECEYLVTFEDTGSALYTITQGTRAAGIGNPGYAVRGGTYSASGGQNGIQAEVDVPTECFVRTVSFDCSFDNRSSSQLIFLSVQLWKDGVMVVSNAQTPAKPEDVYFKHTVNITADCDFVRIRAAHQNTVPVSGKHIFIDNIKVN